MVSLLFIEGDQGAKYNIEKIYYKYIYICDPLCENPAKSLFLWFAVFC